MTTSMIAITILAGFAAGVINTLAGGGSIITLSLLSFLSLPVNIANGTNRVGILLQSFTSTVKFKQARMLNLFSEWKVIVATSLGAIFGSVLASVLEPEAFQYTAGWIFVGLFFVLLLRPEKRIKSTGLFKKLAPFAMFFVGVYAGFIQAGAGIFMLAIMTTVLQKKITLVNPLKVFIILAINAIVLIVYGWNGQVNWEIGLVLALGQFIGAFVGVRLNNSKKNIEPILRLLLLIIVVLSVLKFWNIINFDFA